MSRKLDEIRKNIAKRKFNKRINYTSQKSHSFGSLLNDEERFGYTSHPFADQGKLGKLKFNFFPKILASVLIFFIVFFLYNDQIPFFSKAKPFVHQVLTEDLPFATVQAWYDEHFATQFVLFGKDKNNIDYESMNSIPVNGVEISDVKNFEDGVYIEVTEAKNVYPMARGSVIFAGKKRDTGNTIIIQHEDGQKSIYGHLDAIDVFHYQFVQPGQVIGTIKPDEVVGFKNMYFAIQDGTKYIDPLQIILGDQDES